MIRNFYASTEEMKRIDRLAIHKYKIPSILLMENAGMQVAKTVNKLFRKSKRIAIFCGKGNNGGDGFAAALELGQSNIPLTIYSLAESDALSGDAGIFHSRCVLAGLPIIYGYDTPRLTEPAILVDGLLGTGFSGDLRGPIQAWTRWVNQQTCPVLAIDVPSGLDANTGQLATDGIRSNQTVTMGYTKLGMVFQPGQSACGRIQIADIGFPPVERELEGLEYKIFEENVADRWLRPPPVDAHKYACGRVLIIAGSAGMTGAAILSARAAIRSGAGLVKICIPASLNSIIETSVIEAISIPVPDENRGYLTMENLNTIEQHLAWCDVALIGPGLGSNPETLKLVSALLPHIKSPVVLDADALRIFKDHTLFDSISVPFVLTPHYGEWSRIIGRDAAWIRANLDRCLEEIPKNMNGILHLKNAPSLTVDQRKIVLNLSGNQGLAGGGTGDVLAGIITALIGQRIPLPEAVQIAAYIHGRAADNLVLKLGYRGMTAGDLISEIPTVISSYEHQTD